MRGGGLCLEVQKDEGGQDASDRPLREGPGCARGGCADRASRIQQGFEGPRPGEAVVVDIAPLGSRCTAGMRDTARALFDTSQCLV